MKIDFDINSKIQVIDETSAFYRFRGTIVKMPERNSTTNIFVNDTIVCQLHDLNNIEIGQQNLRFAQVKNIQKKFIDIEYIRENDVDLGNGLIRKGNTTAFELNDTIQITTKIDGANASIAYNKYDHTLEVFSRTNLLTNSDGLRGFKSYIETQLSKDDFSKFPNYVIFGEWCVRHTVKYPAEFYNKWRVYDIWDKSICNYLDQNQVKDFCNNMHLEYVHELYYGPFISWDHCRSFLHTDTYGPVQEGIVIKNQSKLDKIEIRAPKYLKIVNDEFVECMKARKKRSLTKDPAVNKAYDEAKTLIETVVTEARVMKTINKFVDSGILPMDLQPANMSIIAKMLPKAIYMDLLKEEPEIMAKAAENAGKLIASISLSHAKAIVIGK